MILNDLNRNFLILFYSFSVSSIINLWIHGEVAEWLKAHAWKACRREDCLAGSNPAFSANEFDLFNFLANNTKGTDVRTTGTVPVVFFLLR